MDVLVRLQRLLPIAAAPTGRFTGVEPRSSPASSLLVLRASLVTTTDVCMFYWRVAAILHDTVVIDIAVASLACVIRACAAIPPAGLCDADVWDAVQSRAGGNAGTLKQFLGACSIPNRGSGTC